MTRGAAWLSGSLACTVAALAAAGANGVSAIPDVVGLALAASAMLWLGHRDAALSVRTLLLVAVGLRLAALPLEPSLSSDGSRYLWDGMVRAKNGASPYAFAPSAHPELNPDLFQKLNSPDYFSVYPPLSQAVFTAAVGWTSGMGAACWLLKGLLVLGELVGIVALSRLVTPGRLALYAWHPLAVLEGAGQGHTEALLVGALGVAVWAWTVRPRWAGTAVVAAAAVKAWPVALLPLAGRQGGWRSVLWPLAGLAVFSVPWVLGADVAGVARSFGLYAGTFDFYSAPYLAVKGMLWPMLGRGAGRASAALMGGLWLVAVAGAALVATRGTDGRRWVMGLVVAYGLLSPVQHPWHWLPVLCLIPLLQHKIPGYWLISVSSATYLRYAGAPSGYAIAVAVGWGGALALAIHAGRRPLLHLVLRRRAVAKWTRLRRALASLPLDGRLLDLGCAEGFVGDRAAEQSGLAVTLADVTRLVKSPRPCKLLGPGPLPYPDAAFDGVLVGYVLHHAADPVEVLREAVRVSRGPVAILETVSGPAWYNPLLHKIDNLSNSIRTPTNTSLLPSHIRSVEEWQRIAAVNDLRLVVRDRWGRIHPQALFSVTRASTSSGEASAGTHSTSS